MKAVLYRSSPVETSALAARGEADKYPPCPWSKRHRMVPAGYVIDHPDAWQLVHQGVAKSGDVECELKAAMTPKQTVRRFERQKALEAGQLTGDPKLDAPNPRHLSRR